MNYTKLKLSIEVGLSNGSMNVEIYSNQQLLANYTDITSNNIELSTDVSLPCHLTFNISNKNPAIDTIVNQQGDIVSDKFMILKGLSLGNIPVQPSLLFAICNYCVDGQYISKYDTYWAFNGKVVIDLLNDNFIQWHLEHNNMFDL